MKPAVRRIAATKPTARLVVYAEGEHHEWWTLVYLDDEGRHVRCRVGSKAYIAGHWAQVKP
jgi:hypothetical protein